MDVAKDSNRRAIGTWNRAAVGSSRSREPKGSRKYFEDIRKYRYVYETPFIPRMFGFSELDGKRVLEVGVGQGFDACEMVRCGAHYTGIDITPNHLDLTRRNFNLSLSEEQRARTELVCGDLLEVSLEDRFDVIYSFGVMHHIAHEYDFYREFYRLLKPEGRLMIAVYSKLSLFYIYMRMHHALVDRGRHDFADWASFLSEGSRLGEPVVLKARYRREVESLLREAGFRVDTYGKRGFVQNYLPGIGRALRPDGVILNALASVLGWYHCFICSRSEIHRPAEPAS